jgi:hypothetical protein
MFNNAAEFTIGMARSQNGTLIFFLSRQARLFGRPDLRLSEKLITTPAIDIFSLRAPIVRSVWLMVLSQGRHDHNRKSHCPSQIKI